ncbi:MAG: DinB family protein [Chloroflexi bacterium]|nr:DinB family protein [Chloroflexota bacterium]
MQATSTETEKLLDLLAETPQRLQSLISRLEDARLQTKLDQDAWSANDILAHLRSCADVWGKSILAMISQDNPTLRYISPRTWMRKTNYPQQEFHRSLQTFTQQRYELLAALKLLTIEDWSRTATFTGTAKGREQTIFSYVQRIVEHEMQHLAQLESGLNAIPTS